jgi:hypothetical protein
MTPRVTAFHEKDLLSFKSRLASLRSVSRQHTAATRRAIPNEYFFMASRRKIRREGDCVAWQF